MLAMRAESMRLICPAPTPSVMPPAQNTMALLLTYLATFQANSMSCICSAVGCLALTTFRSASDISWLSAVWISRPEPTRLKSWALRPCSNAALLPAGSAMRSTRVFGLAANTASASGLKLGAISTSTNCLATSAAPAASSSVLKAMMPPKADVGSVLKALL